MSITPGRLLVLSIVVFAAFIMCHSPHRSTTRTVRLDPPQKSEVIRLPSLQFSVSELPSEETVDTSPPPVPLHLGAPPPRPSDGFEEHDWDDCLLRMDPLIVDLPIDIPDDKPQKEAIISEHEVPPSSPDPLPIPDPAKYRKILAAARRLLGTKPGRAAEKLATLEASLRTTDRIVERALAFYWRGRALRIAGHPEESIKSYERAIELAPQRAQFFNGLAWTLLTIEPARYRDPVEALRLARRAVDLTNHGNPNFLDTLGRALFLTGDYSTAWAIQRAAVDMAPDNPHYARRLNQYERAQSVVD